MRITSALLDLIDEKGADKALAVKWLKEALDGDPRFFAMLLDRVEGKVADRLIHSTDNDDPTPRVAIPKTDDRATD